MNLNKTHHRVEIKLVFIAKNPNPQYAINPKVFKECMHNSIKKNHKWFRKLVDQDLKLDTANNIGLLQQDWFPEGSFNNVLIEVSKAGRFDDVISAKPRWLSWLLRLFP